MSIMAIPIERAAELSLTGEDIDDFDDGVPCPECECELALFQPNEADGRRLVGYCEHCEELFLLLEHAHGTRSYRLPAAL